MTNGILTLEQQCREAARVGIVVGAVLYVEHALWAELLDDLSLREPEIALLARYTLGTITMGAGALYLASRWRSTDILVACIGLGAGGLSIVAERLRERHLRSVHDDGKELGRVAGILEGVRRYAEAYGRAAAAHERAA